MGKYNSYQEVYSAKIKEGKTPDWLASKQQQVIGAAQQDEPRATPSLQMLPMPPQSMPARSVSKPPRSVSKPPSLKRRGAGRGISFSTLGEAFIRLILAGVAIYGFYLIFRIVLEYTLLYYNSELALFVLFTTYFFVDVGINIFKYLKGDIAFWGKNIRFWE